MRDLEERRSAPSGPLSRRPRAAGPGHPLLALQQLAGNAATTRSVQRAAGSYQVVTGSQERETSDDRSSVTGAISRSDQADATATDAELRARLQAQGSAVHSAVGGHSSAFGEGTANITGSRRAVVIANQRYVAQPHLPGATADGDAMQGVARRHGYGVQRHDDVAGPMIGALFGEALRSAKPGDGVLLHFAGHGAPEGAVGIFQPRRRPVADLTAYGTIATAVDDASSRGVNVTAVVDTCNSGALNRELRRKHFTKMAAADPRTAQLAALARFCDDLRDRLPSQTGGGDGQRGLVLDQGPSTPVDAATAWATSVRPVLLFAMLLVGHAPDLPPVVHDPGLAQQHIDRVVGLIDARAQAISDEPRRSAALVGEAPPSDASATG